MMKSSMLMVSLAVALGGLLSSAQAATDNAHTGASVNTSVKPAASATMSASQVRATTATKATVQPKALEGGAATGVITQGGDSSIPAGSVPIPPKPKKEGIEGVNVKANKAAQP